MVAQIFEVAEAEAEDEGVAFTSDTQAFCSA